MRANGQTCGALCFRGTFSSTGKLLRVNGVRILSTFGVKQLLCQGDRPSLISGEFVESLKCREREGVVVSPDRKFEMGQAVRLTGGTFDGLTATIAELDHKSRVTILLNLLNGQVRARVPLDGIREL